MRICLVRYHYTLNLETLQGPYTKSIQLFQKVLNHRSFRCVWLQLRNQLFLEQTINRIECSLASNPDVQNRYRDNVLLH